MSNYIFPSLFGFGQISSTSGVLLPGAGYFSSQVTVGPTTITVSDLSVIPTIDTLTFDQWHNEIKDISAAITLQTVALTQNHAITVSDLAASAAITNVTFIGELVIDNMAPGIVLGTISIGDTLQVSDAAASAEMTQSLLSDLFGVSDISPSANITLVSLIPTASIYGLHLFNIVIFNDELSTSDISVLASTSATHNYNEMTCSGDMYMPPIVDTLNNTVKSNSSYTVTLGGKLAVAKPISAKENGAYSLTWGPMQGAEVYKVRDFIDAHGLFGTFYFTPPNGARKLYRFSPSGTLSITATPYKLFKIQAEIVEA